MPDSKHIRDSFLKFFKEKGHKIIPSAPVIPFNDNTLLFTNAGMNQFKDVLLGTGKREYKRCANSQKCIRAGGKHNDLEEVGSDGYHHTFFEMLGNWSFGDYYKKEAIKWAWELLTSVWQLPKDRLWATVYDTDEESHKLWLEETDIEPEHLLKFGEKDNFWEMGETGPCGPCSEIHFDSTETGCSINDINSNNEDVIEIWNLVFIQYNRNTEGSLSPLPEKHIDTGMGLERITRILQNKKSNYETDIFAPIINYICKITKSEYKGDSISPINAIADHIRALCFAISDGANPSNEGRGYVLRRILRRASRLARKLDYHKPFLYKITDIVTENFGDIYPELKSKQLIVKDIIKSEEISFNKTLDKGIDLFNEVYDKIGQNPDKIFPGEEAFKLYDTYGFPLDLTQQMAREKGFTVDINGFEDNMKIQKERARSARKTETININIENTKLSDTIDKHHPNYNPYIFNETGIKTKILDAFPVPDSETEIIILENNPFYSESGGQISDTGKIIFNDGYEIEVIDVQNNYYIYVKNNDKREMINKEVITVVDYKRRKSIMRNHSATHLLHEALRIVLGSHIKQMGSLVSDKYLRFDFSHFQKITGEQLTEIENIVNQKISDGIKVETAENIPVKDASQISSVKMFFGEKYGETVRVVTMDSKYSAELCGGTHVSNTNEIGYFKIIKEESISSGIRRIFARTGEGLKEYLYDKISDAENLLNELPDKLCNELKKTITEQKVQLNNADFTNIQLMKNLFDNQNNIIVKISELKEKYIQGKKISEKKIRKELMQKTYMEIDKSIANAECYNGVLIVLVTLQINDKEDIREIAEYYNKVLKDGVSLSVLIQKDKYNIACYINKTLVEKNKISAGKIISSLATQLGNKGGGRPEFAVAGLSNKNQIDEAFKLFINIIKESL